MIKDDVMKSALKDIAEEYGLTPKQVEDIFESQFCCIRNTISELDLRNAQTEEEYDEIKVNFNIPEIGKLHTCYGNLTYIKNQIEEKRKKYGKEN